MKYIELIDTYKEDIIKSLQGLLAFDSIANENEEGTPFGAQVQKSLDYMLALAQKDGFATLNTDDMAGHIETGEGEQIVGVLVHLDIVPAGNDWDFDPFGRDISEGNLYGRGAMDNKGPAIMAYYAMKALKEAAAIEPALALKKRVRLILGLDEEKGAWKSIPYYLQKSETPDIGFTPDSDFPVIHAEMGILIFDVVKKLSKVNQTGGLMLRSIKGGNAHNMVADWCTAVVSGDKGYDDIKKSIEDFTTRTGYQVSAKGRGRALEITSCGVSAHGATPELGQSAISVMMAFLSEIDIQGDDIREFIDFYNSKIGFDLHGAGGIGCDLADEVSGKLLYNVGKIHVDEQTAVLTNCIRYPVTGNGEQVYDSMRNTLNEYDLGVVKIEDKEPVYFPVDSKLVKSLMAVYQKHTGDHECKPAVAGGGTYARAAKNIIAFGPAMPGEVKREHQKNEYIEIERLISTTKIYADAIFSLANE